MANEPIVSTLGGVSAYLDAVAHGFSGTREEFGELLANGATYYQRAESAAQRADNDANIAQNAAAAATQGAQTATNAAGTATNAAQSASADAATANAAAGTATTAATNASSSATAAATSATNAGQFATNADLSAQEAAATLAVAEAAIEAKGAEVEAEVDGYIADAQTAIDTLEAQKDTIAQTVASMAQLGTDTTLTTQGMAADAKATGDKFTELSSDLGVIDFSDVSTVLFEGVCTLKSANFEQGYMQSGGGWKSTGSGDSLKYITFRCDTKLCAGSNISVSCPDHYCAIDLYADNNWNANSMRLDSVNYAKTIVYTMQHDGYLAITVATSNKYAQRVAISPSDYAETITITPINYTIGEILERLGKYPLTNGTVYDGERIDVSKHYCAAESFFTMSHTTTSSIQGGACYGKYLFQFMDKFSGCAIYDLETKSLVQLIETQSVDTYHCNNANFGVEFYDETDDFPLLYVSQENIAEHKVTVFRVTKTNGVYGLTLVQTITWDSPDTIQCYFPNAIIDAENMHIIQYGTKNNSWYADSPGNMLRFNVYALPTLSAGDVTLSQSARVDNFDLEMVQAPQGAVCKNGKIYMAFGLISDYQIRAISLDKKAYVSIIDLTKPELSVVTGGEQEAVIIYEGHIYCTNVNKQVWKLLT